MMTLDVTAQLAPVLWGVLAVLLAAAVGILTCIDPAELRGWRNAQALRHARRPGLAGILGRLLPWAPAAGRGSQTIRAAV